MDYRQHQASPSYRRTIVSDGGGSFETSSYIKSGATFKTKISLVNTI